MLHFVFVHRLIVPLIKYMLTPVQYNVTIQVNYLTYVIYWLKVSRYLLASLFNICSWFYLSNLICDVYILL